MIDFFTNSLANAIGSLVAAAAIGLLGRNKFFALSRLVQTYFLPAGKGTHFTILVSQLEDDTPDCKQTKHVIASIRSQLACQSDLRPFEVLYFPKILKSTFAGTVAADRKAGNQKGLEWLNQQNADLLIWGEVAQIDRVIRLEFLAREGEYQRQHNYALTETLELPIDFKDHLVALLTSMILLITAPALNPTQPLTKILLPLLPRLKNIVDHGQGDLSAECFGSICNSAGAVFKTFGEQSGESFWMNESIAAFSKVIQTFNSSEFPKEWALAQSNLGGVLGMMSQLNEGETANRNLVLAIEAFESALTIQTQIESPIDWARSQANLSNVYRILGSRSVGKKSRNFFMKAIEAIEKSFLVFTKKDEEFDWATNQLNISIIYCDLAKLSEGHQFQELAEKAVKAAGAALSIFSASSFPIQWAMTQSSLGAIVGMLGQRGIGNPSIELLRISISAFENSLIVYTQNDFVDNHAMTQINLGNVLMLLGQRNQEKTAFSKAVVAYRAAFCCYARSGFENSQMKAKDLLTLAEVALAQ